MVNGIVSGFLAKAILLPIDNVKKRLQVQGLNDFQSNHKGMIDCLKTTFSESGLAMLYRGVVVSALKVRFFFLLQIIFCDISTENGVIMFLTLDPFIGCRLFSIFLLFVIIHE